MKSLFCLVLILYSGIVSAVEPPDSGLPDGDKWQPVFDALGSELSQLHKGVDEHCELIWYRREPVEASTSVHEDTMQSLTRMLAIPRSSLVEKWAQRAPAMNDAHQFLNYLALSGRGVGSNLLRSAFGKVERADIAAYVLANLQLLTDTYSAAGKYVSPGKDPDAVEQFGLTVASHGIMRFWMAVHLYLKQMVAFYGVIPRQTVEEQGDRLLLRIELNDGFPKELKTYQDVKQMELWLVQNMTRLLGQPLSQLLDDFEDSGLFD